MRRAAVEVYLYGADWIAHRPEEPGHSCEDGTGAHGMADTVTSAVRKLIKAEGES